LAPRSAISVNLPPRIKAAIERKAEQYQATLEYDFRIEREKKERDRKKIEAEGIRDFQDTVARTITPEYLRLRGIEATISLATSQNSKVIVIGGKDGLPLILNTGDDGSAKSSAVVGASPGPASLDNSALISAPHNARLDDIPAVNAKVPLTAPAPSATSDTPEMPPLSDEPPHDGIPPVSDADSNLPQGEANTAVSTDAVPAKVDEEANPATVEPSLVDKIKDGLSGAWANSSQGQ